MCGIGGVLGLNIDQPKVEAVFRDTLKERGPNAFGSYINDALQLYHARLSIIDLSENANQPMVDEKNGNVIVFNGEIYNFIELKALLLKEGVYLKTKSDTEVLLKAIPLWGIENTLSRIEGMFVFAYLDVSEGKLLFARDRFGKKPLYYRKTEGDFCFSSNIVSLSKLLRDRLEVNYKVYDYYLRELAMPQPHTIWQEVFQLPPASWMSLDINSNALSEPKRYWSLNKLSVNTQMTEEEALDKSERLLKEAVKKRLISDVPIGFFLSGGIDSGLIVSMAAEMSAKPISTFTATFDDEATNEAPLAKLLARKYGTDHNEIHIAPDVRKTAEKIIDYVGEPFADYSLIPSFEICQAIRQHATVALSGDGGDELFAGYKHYVDYYASQKLSATKFPKTYLNVSKILSRIAPSEFVNIGAAKGFLGLSPQRAALRLGGTKQNNILSNLVNVDSAIAFTDAYIDTTTTNYFEGASAATKQQLSSLDKLLLNNYLVKVDRASMANSLEVRSPFLDHRLAEFAFTVPDSLKLKGYKAKYLLKKLASEKFARNVFKEPKRGFQIPLGSWMRGELKSWVKELLFDSLIHRGLFDSKQIRTVWEEHQLKQNQTDLLWKLVSLELWYANHYDA